MSNHKYVNPDGSEVFVTCSIPGFSMVPPGHRYEDAIPVADEDMPKRKAIAPVANDLGKKVSDLEATVAKLQAHLDKLTKP